MSKRGRITIRYGAEGRWIEWDHRKRKRRVQRLIFLRCASLLPALLSLLLGIGLRIETHNVQKWPRVLV